MRNAASPPTAVRRAHHAEFDQRGGDARFSATRPSGGTVSVDGFLDWDENGAGLLALGAYGGVFVAGSLAWGVVADGFRPDRWDLAGAAGCLLGVAVIRYAPRGAE